MMIHSIDRRALIPESILLIQFTLRMSNINGIFHFIVTFLSLASFPSLFLQSETCRCS
jgi:hypothetical protein